MINAAVSNSSSPAPVAADAAARPSRPYTDWSSARSARNGAYSSPCTSGIRYKVAMLWGAPTSVATSISASAYSPLAGSPEHRDSSVAATCRLGRTDWVSSSSKMSSLPAK
jgi:hypothetical protein